MTGKYAVMEMLRAEGVGYIFGNPGTTETPIMDALESYPDIKYMLSVQEGVAMGMADSYGRASGSPSFVNLHIETGLANGISLLHNACEGGSPIVLTSLQQGRAGGRTRSYRPAGDGAPVHEVECGGEPPGRDPGGHAPGVPRGQDAAHRSDLPLIHRQRPGRRGRGRHHPVVGGRSAGSARMPRPSRERSRYWRAHRTL